MGSDDVLNVLSDLDVAIIHIKPTFLVHKDTERSRELIESELSNPVNQSYSSMGVHFVIPKQTDMIYVKAGKLMGHFALNSAKSDISKTFSLYIFAIVLNVYCSSTFNCNTTHSLHFIIIFTEYLNTQIN